MLRNPAISARSILPLAVLLSLNPAGCDSPVGGDLASRPWDGPAEAGWNDPDMPAEGALDFTGFRAPAPPSPPGVAPAGQLSLINFDQAGGRLVRLDTQGNSIDAHDGEIERFGDLYYLYGAAYGCGFHWRVAGTPFCGIKVYSSPDLVEWTYRGLLFDPFTVEWQLRCDGSTHGCFRPHIAYNARTNRYVLWLNTYDLAVGYRVFEAVSPTGPFVEREPPRLAVSGPLDPYNNQFSGDHNLFVDDNGAGYLIYTDWRRGGDIVVEALTRDYLSGTGRHVRLGLRYSEAPSMFRRGDRYYITFSDPACPYCRTGTSYMTATHPLGSWHGRKLLNATSCGGQPSHVSPLPGSDGTQVYLYQSDLWNNHERNQAPAGQFWAPLRFSPGGEIEPFDCDPLVPVPIAAARPADDPLMIGSRLNLQCDIGAHGGHIRREVRMVAERTGRLTGLALPVYKQGRPDSPLHVEVHSDGGAVLQRLSIPAKSISWHARRQVLEANVPLTAGQPYAVRIHASLSNGCYGFGYYHDAQPRRDPQLFVSTYMGPWQRESERTLRLDVRVVED